jgi:hypothetical protein
VERRLIGIDTETGFGEDWSEDTVFATGFVDDPSKERMSATKFGEFRFSLEAEVLDLNDFFSFTESPLFSSLHGDRAFLKALVLANCNAAYLITSSTFTTSSSEGMDLLLRTFSPKTCAFRTNAALSAENTVQSLPQNCVDLSGDFFALLADEVDVDGAEESDAVCANLCCGLPKVVKKDKAGGPRRVDRIELLHKWQIYFERFIAVCGV